MQLRLNLRFPITGRRRARLTPEQLTTVFATLDGWQATADRIRAAGNERGADVLDQGIEARRRIYQARNT